MLEARNWEKFNFKHGTSKTDINEFLASSKKIACSSPKGNGAI